MLTALIAVAIALILVMGTFAAQSTKKSINSHRPRMKLSKLTFEEMQKVKDYASIFGVDNSMAEISTEDLLDMGRKVEQAMGRDRFKELVMQVQSHQYHPPVVSNEVDARRQSLIIRQLVDSSKLILGSVVKFKFYLMRGGELDGKEQVITF